MKISKKHTRPRTPAQVRELFRAHGVPVSAWAKQHGVHPNVVFDLLHGRTKGGRGKSHRVAILLGLKPAPDDSLPGAA